MSKTRKLAAILVAEVVGYSRPAGADEERTLARGAGDSSIIEFRSVVDTVSRAIGAWKPRP